MTPAIGGAKCPTCPVLYEGCLAFCQLPTLNASQYDHHGHDLPSLLIIHCSGFCLVRLGETKPVFHWISFQSLFEVNEQMITVIREMSCYGIQFTDFFSVTKIINRTIVLWVSCFYWMRIYHLISYIHVHVYTTRIQNEIWHESISQCALDISSQSELKKAN